MRRAHVPDSGLVHPNPARAADSTGMIADYEVKLVRDGATVGPDRAGTTPWPDTFACADYGGPSDRWGATWAPAWP